MKTIIAGSRSITSYDLVSDAVRKSGFDISEVFCGAARGVDLAGAVWGKAHGVPVRYFPADWKSLGKRAGYARNEEMAQQADALVAVWDGKSPGTKHMIDIARKAGLKVFISLDGEHIPKLL